MQTSFQTSANFLVFCTQHSRTLLLAPNCCSSACRSHLGEGEAGEEGKGGDRWRKCGKEKTYTHTRRQTRNLRTSPGIKYIWNKNFWFYLICSFKPLIFSFYSALYFRSVQVRKQPRCKRKSYKKALHPITQAHCQHHSV